MARYFTLSFFFLCLLTVNCQNYERIDSLQLELLKVTKDEVKVDILLKISRAEELRDPEKSLKYAQQALQVAKQADFDNAEIRAMILMGANYNRLNLLKEAIEIGELIVEKATKSDLQLEIADGRGIMAVAYAKVGDFDNSSKLYFENLMLYEKLNEKRLQGRTLGNIGADFIDQQSYAKALEYTNKALRIGLETKYLTLVTDQYNNLAAIYQVGYNDLKKAMQNYLEALKVAIKIEDFQQQGGILLNIGRIYMKTNNYDSAKVYFDQSFAIFQRLNNPVLLGDSYIALGYYYFQKDEYINSKNFALKGLEIGEKFGVLQTNYEAANLLNKICLSLNDTVGAYKYLSIGTNTKDSLYKLQNQKEIFKIEFQYNQDKRAKEQKIRQQRYYFVIGLIILGLVLGLIIILLFYSRQKIKIKNTIIEKEKAEVTLRFKSKELSINLLALLKKNELLAEISQKLVELVKVPSRVDMKEAILRLNHEIKQSSDDRLWQEFSIRFKETNSEFYEKLQNRFPGLTQSELKLCAYLRLNMSNKEISDLTGQRTETLETARYRLRKKLGLTNSECNLVAFLSQV